MNSKEWSLIIFSLAMQLSVGLVLIYDLFLLFPVYRNRVDIPAKFQWIIMISLAVAITGVIFSLLHLGSPAQATQTLSNVGTSWLSREILCVLFYTLLLAAVAFMHFKMPQTSRLLKWLVDLTAIAGLFLIYVMSRVYMIPSRPAWDTFFTPLGFYLATIIMGASLILVFQINHGSLASQKILAIITIGIPAIQLAILPVYMAWLGQLGLASGNGIAVLLSNHMLAFYLRLLFYLAAIAFGLWAFLSIRSDTVQNRFLFTPAFLSWIAILAAQLVDRYLFYTQNFSPDGF